MTILNVPIPRVTAAVIALTLAVAFAPVPSLRAQQRPVFRSSREMVSIDVVVRDRDGNIVRGLTQADFEIREDGQPQDLLTFTFQEVLDRLAGKTLPAAPTELLAGVEARMAEPAKTTAATPEAVVPVVPMTSDALAGRRP